MSVSTRIKVSISKDGMSALVEVSRGPSCGVAELQAALSAAGVSYSMLDAPAFDALVKQLARPDFQSTGMVVARGRPSVPGIDGYFEPAFPMGIQPGHVDANGAMDFFDRELLKPLSQGDFLGQLHRPLAGVPGVRVDGIEIKLASARESKLRAGASVTLAADGCMYAALPGVVVYAHEQTIDVAQQHEHNGDVDLRSGTLHMEGSISVRGSVQRQFAVRATGNVDVQGHVESGTVVADGCVRISGRVYSGDAGLVCAEGDVSIHHCEAAQVRCAGLLKLETAVNSELRAAKIQILHSIRGGSAQAETSVVVGEAGSARAATGTVLAAAVPLQRPLSDVKHAIESAKYKRSVQHAAARDSDDRGKGGKAGRAAAALHEKELARKAAIAARRDELLASAHVQVNGAAYPGVTVQLGVHSLQLEERVAGVRFVFDEQLGKICKQGAV